MCVCVYVDGPTCAHSHVHVHNAGAQQSSFMLAGQGRACSGTSSVG